MFVRVDVHKQKKNEFKKDILWRFVKMRCLRQSEGKHKGNQNKWLFNKHFKRTYVRACRCALEKGRNSQNTYYDDLWKRYVNARVQENTRKIGTNELSESGVQAVQKYICSCVSMCIKQMNSEQTCYDDLWEWDLYANVKGNTEGINTHIFFNT